MKSFKLICKTYYRKFFSYLTIGIVTIILVSFSLVSCGTTKNSETQRQKVEMICDNDSTE